METLLSTSKNLITMQFFRNPSKKIRLDLSNNFDLNVGNDDLWGQEDITAEEFDMLEVQATQAQPQVDHSSNTFHQPFRNTDGVSLAQAEELKQQQYELEGKVKILSDSLEKLSKELKEEKLNKDRCVKEKVQEFQEKENTLHKEIKKLQSVLEFKNQEMKTVYEKVHGLEAQLREKTAASEMPSNKSPNKFLEKFKFQTNADPLSSEFKEIQSTRPSRKYKLLVDAPQGKTPGSDIVSSILCNRLVLTPASNLYVSPLLSTQPGVESSDKNSVQLSAMSITRINSEQQTEELFDYFSSVLQNYLSQLKSISSKVPSTSFSIKSPLSSRNKDINHERVTVISCLKDLTYIISCPQFNSLIKTLESKEEIEAEKEMSSEETISENPQLVVCDSSKRCKNKFKSLLQTLVCLANPDTYPNGYSKEADIEWSLAALVSWSSASENFLCFLDEIPVSLLVNCIHSVTYSHMGLKFMTNLCSYKEFLPKMIHKDGECLLCAIAEFSLQNICSSPLQFTSIMLMIENFFSTIFTVHNLVELNLESALCSSMVLQGIITSLSKFHEVFDKSNHEVMLVMKKGFNLVHLLSKYFPNFKGQRTSFEDCYISLICGMLTLSKENPMFKDFYDLIHDLWDFQEDTNEFDLEEFSEDSSHYMETSSKSDC